MTQPRRAVVTGAFGVYLVEAGSVVRALVYPDDLSGLTDRARQRREGRLTPEEEQLLSERGDDRWVSRDRRLTGHGVEFDPGAPLVVESAGGSEEMPRAREMLLADATRALELAWDPSIHLQEAVRAAADLERVGNLVGERLGSWVSRDRPEIDPGDHRRAAREALTEGSPTQWAPAEPGLSDARKRLARLYSEIEEAKGSLTDAIDRASPSRTPNLASLLGPELSARLVAQAGGLDRLARMPASTVQVLGAERAFFEHLRGRAPPPRHGLLFVHPAIQSAPRAHRGKLARALAGKVAIAARLDRAGAPLDPALARAFESRRAAVRALPAGRAPRSRRARSGPPLDRAARDS